MQIQEIQKALREEKVDGWLFFDHHQRDPLAYRILKLGAGRIVTRRWFYLIPAQGEPKGLVHAIESGVLTGLPNARRTGRGPFGVIADMSKPYLSTPVMLAEVISVACEKALQ